MALDGVSVGTETKFGYCPACRSHEPRTGLSVNAYRDRSGAEDGQRVAPVIHNNVEPNVELIVLLAADRVSCGISRDNLASVTRLQISFR